MTSSTDLDAGSEEESEADVDSEEDEYSQLLGQLEGSAPGMSKDRLPYAHLCGIRQIQDSILRPHALPPDLQEVTSEIQRLGPAGAHLHRSMAMQSARSLSKRSLSQDNSLLCGVDPRVRKVLDAAGDSGAHPEFFRQLLEKYGYKQMQIVQALLGGFPLVGVIPAESSVRPFAVTKSTATKEDLQCMAPKLTAKAIAKQQRQSRKSADREVHREIFKQTEEDIHVGCISGWELVVLRAVAPPTRRFGVKQAASSGKQKIRCIDDLKESRINSLCEVTGKIRMGSIADLVEMARQLQASAPEAPLVIFKTDFK